MGTEDVRFMIQVDDVYYLSTGPFLTYDPKAVKGDPKKEQGVKEVQKKFKEIKDSPNTWHVAVRIKDAGWEAVNTGP